MQPFKFEKGSSCFSVPNMNLWVVSALSRSYHFAMIANFDDCNRLSMMHVVFLGVEFGVIHHYSFAHHIDYPLIASLSSLYS